jgi:SAM-dependent methyltransferase
MIQSEIDSHVWFHAIDFGDVCSRGRDKPANWSLYATLDYLENLDLTDSACLDLGTMDGLSAFLCHEVGASKVVATNLFDRDTFYIARDLLNYPVEYHGSLHINDYRDTFDEAAFDVLVCAGVIYHVASPLSTLLMCRHHIKNNGWIIVETVVAPGEDHVLHLNAAVDPPHFQEYTTYFVPTVNAVESMLTFAGFEPVSTSVTSNGRRATVLARAVAPSAIPGRTELMAEVHERLTRPGPALFPEVDYAALEAAAGPASTVSYSGHHGRRELNIYDFRARTSLQPTPERLEGLGPVT